MIKLIKKVGNKIAALADGTPMAVTGFFVLIIIGLIFHIASNQPQQSTQDTGVKSSFKESLASPSPTVTRAPKPTEKPNVKTKSITKTPTIAPQPTNTPLPTVTKVPVVLPHNGLTYYCDPSVAQSVKDASLAVKQSTEEYIECQNSKRSSIQACVDSCKNITLDVCGVDSVRISLGYSSYDDCVDKRSKESIDCINDCYNGPLAKLGQEVCEIGASNASNSLNNLLDRYCK